MASLIVVDSNRLVAEHQQVLRDYAKRVILNCHVLAPEEDDDLANRMQEFFAVGSSLKLTEREMVSLILKPLFSKKRGCDCPSCRARAGA